jgi:acyl-CoA hydrolase
VGYETHWVGDLKQLHFKNVPLSMPQIVQKNASDFKGTIHGGGTISQLGILATELKR